MRPSPKLEETEDALNGKAPLNTDAVLAFCQEFIKENATYCFTPYIVGNPDPAFNKIPEHHQERLNGLKAYWEQEALKREDEKRAGLEKAEPEHDEDKKLLLSSVLRQLDKNQPVDSSDATNHETERTVSSEQSLE